MNLPSVIPWWAKALGVLAIVCGLAYAGWHAYSKVTSAYYAAGLAVGDAKIATLKAQYAQATAKAQADARATEQARAEVMTQIQQTYYQQGITDANAKSAAVIAGLRDGNLRLRHEWTCPGTTDVSAVGASGPGAAAAAQLRAANAEQVHREIAGQIRDDAEADATIRALQAIVKADREKQ